MAFDRLLGFHEASFGKSEGDPLFSPPARFQRQNGAGSFRPGAAPEAISAEALRSRSVTKTGFMPRVVGSSDFYPHFCDTRESPLYTGG